MNIGPDFIGQVISLIVVILLFLSMLLTKKAHYAISGLTLISLGLFPLLYNNYIIPLDITRYPVINFAAYFLVIFASRDLFKEGMKEKQSLLKVPSIVFAGTLIILTTIPTLYNMQVISFNLPEYAPMINQVIYIASGLFLLIGIFTLLKSKE